MKRLFCYLVIALLFSGCQSPMVTTRSYSFETKILVNGKNLEVKTPYTCYYEDLTWVSTRGKDWHIREGTNLVRANGSLDDGARFEVVPRQKRWNYSFCPSKTEPIDVQLFVEKDASQVESFDNLRNLSASRNVESIDAKLSHVGSGLAPFVEQNNWPLRTGPAKRYYTVYAVIYKSAIWKSKPNIVELIANKKILWLESGKTYPFSTWTENDMSFGRLREFDPNLNGYTDSAPRLPLVPKDEIWVFSAVGRNAVQWRLEPLPSNKSEERELVPSEKFKRWIVFNDSRIEIPLRNYYRTFYQPEHDQLIEFRVEHVNLW